MFMLTLVSYVSLHTAHEGSYTLNTWNTLNTKAIGRKPSPAAKLPGLTSRGGGLGDVPASGSCTYHSRFTSISCLLGHIRNVIGVWHRVVMYFHAWFPFTFSH